MTAFPKLTPRPPRIRTLADNKMGMQALICCAHSLSGFLVPLGGPGLEAGAELCRVAEQLERVEGGLDNINQDMKEAEEHLKGPSHLSHG